MLTHRLALIAGIATALAIVPAAASAAGGQGRYTTIDVPGAAATLAATVNDAGVVVGFYTDRHGTTRGFADRRGVFTTVTVPGATRTQVDGINDQGVMVGFYIDRHGAFHGFIDRGGVVTTVNDPTRAPPSFKGQPSPPSTTPA